jgi:hypothetical protein
MANLRAAMPRLRLDMARLRAAMARLRAAVARLHAVMARLRAAMARSIFMTFGRWRDPFQEFRKLWHRGTGGVNSETTNMLE